MELNSNVSIDRSNSKLNGQGQILRSTECEFCAWAFTSTAFDLNKGIVFEFEIENDFLKVGENVKIAITSETDQFQKYSDANLKMDMVSFISEFPGYFFIMAAFF